EVVGEAAHVVVRLDVRGPGAAARLHHVRVERALHQVVGRLTVRAGLGGDVPRGPLERANELAANGLALLLGVRDPLEGGQELGGRVDDVQLNPGRGDEVLLDLLRLALAQQPVVNEHAGQLVADGALDQGGGDGGVNPAGQPADRPAVANLVPD